MIKILMVCHGNICRSPMAEFVMKDMLKKIGRDDGFYIESAATSYEEIGSPVYPPVRRLLNSHGIDCSGKTARRIEKADYTRFHLIIGMDDANMVNLVRFFNGDPEGKVHNLLDFAGRIGESIADPWYTGEFKSAWEDVNEGCLALINLLCRNDTVVLDLRDCKSKQELYAVMASAMLWPDSYGCNLDALQDVLTGMPHYGSSFKIIADPTSPVYDYIQRIYQVFVDSGTDCGLEAPDIQTTEDIVLSD